MYTQFFGLKQEPFSIAPDPRYLFMSERHREALAHLLYGVQGGGGFVLLTGEIGAGKTTVCRCFLEQIPPHCNVAYIFNPKLTVTELLKTVCEEFRVPHDRLPSGTETVKQYLDPLNEFLLRTHAVGQNNVLIIDEAQNLSPDVLEQLRLLTNLETRERKLLQIMLIGQPELRTMLAKPELEQLAQRVIARYHLKALSDAETAQYIKHRLGVAGLRGALPFDREARQRIHQLSRGVPRRINLLCDRSLLGAYAQGRTQVNRATVDKAAREVFEMADRGPAHPKRGALALAGVGGLVAGVVLLGVVAWGMNVGLVRQTPVVLPPVAAASVPSAASAPAQNAEVVLSPAITVALRNESDAWRELARRWKAELPEGDPCEVAPLAQLHCFKGDGGLALLRQLGRPSILKLHDETGKPTYVTLVGLTGNSATVSVGSVTQSVSLLSLTRYWHGEFATLWRAPVGFKAKLVGGETGPVVDWLAAQLAQVYGEPPPAGAQKFDAAMRAKVAAFQRAQGLKDDGRAGPMTFMQLNGAVGIAEPRLAADAAVN